MLIRQSGGLYRGHLERTVIRKLLGTSECARNRWRWGSISLSVAKPRDRDKRKGRAGGNMCCGALYREMLPLIH